MNFCAFRVFSNASKEIESGLQVFVSSAFDAAAGELVQVKEDILFRCILR